MADVEVSFTVVMPLFDMHVLVRERARIVSVMVIECGDLGMHLCVLRAVRRSRRLGGLFACRAIGEGVNYA